MEHLEDAGLATFPKKSHLFSFDAILYGDNSKFVLAFVVVFFRVSCLGTMGRRRGRITFYFGEEDPTDI
jgi:hypothetical protein